MFFDQRTSLGESLGEKRQFFDILGQVHQVRNSTESYNMIAIITYDDRFILMGAKQVFCSMFLDE